MVWGRTNDVLPIRIDLRIPRGDHRNFKFRVKRKTGEKVDLSLFVDLVAQIRASKDSSEVLTEFFIDLTNSDLAEGIIFMRLETAKTEILPRTCWYDFQFRNPDNETMTLFEGIINITREVTRPN